MKLPRLRDRSEPHQGEEQETTPPAEAVKFGALRYERQQPPALQKQPAIAPLPRRSSSAGGPSPRRSDNEGGPLPPRNINQNRPVQSGSVSLRNAAPRPRPATEPQTRAPQQPARRPIPQAAAAPARRALAHQKVEQTKRRLHQHEADQRFQHELKEMEETDDLREVDDDVEDVATLAEWRALEHNHRPKSPAWYAVLAAGITIISVGFLLFGNIIGAITIALAGGMVYYIAQQEPRVVRYRLMTEGVAFNNTLYHYRDLEAFNIVYEPGEVKTVILRSNRTFAPLLHMEIGDADPLAIRDLLLEFVHEDQDLLEPLVDIYARRWGF